MCVLEFDFMISHIPGKHVHTADMLSRKPLQPSVEALASTGKEYEHLTIKYFSASAEMLKRNSAALQKNTAAANLFVMHYSVTKWPK